MNLREIWIISINFWIDLYTPALCIAIVHDSILCSQQRLLIWVHQQNVAFFPFMLVIALLTAHIVDFEVKKFFSPIILAIYGWHLRKCIFQDIWVPQFEIWVGRNFHKKWILLHIAKFKNVRKFLNKVCEMFKLIVLWWFTINCSRTFSKFPYFSFMKQSEKKIENSATNIFSKWGISDSIFYWFKTSRRSQTFAKSWM